MYFVIIEWDGKLPPTTWYKRLRQIGLSVRGDGNKETSPLERRTKYVQKGTVDFMVRQAHTWGEGKHIIDETPSVSGKTVIAQEGIILCASESLRNTLAHIAKQQGAKMVLVGKSEIDPYNSDSISAEDLEQINRISNIFGRRGRPSTVTHDYAVTCFEENASYNVLDVREVANCSICHGVRIRPRIGTVQTYTHPVNDTALDAWMRMRFSQGQFEVNTVDNVGGRAPPPLSAINVRANRERDTVDIIANSPEFLALLKGIDPHLSMQLLDSVFGGRTYIPAKSRSPARIKALTLAFTKGASPVGVSLAEDPTKVDILDAAYHMGDERIANLWMRLTEQL